MGDDSRGAWDLERERSRKVIGGENDRKWSPRRDRVPPGRSRGSETGDKRGCAIERNHRERRLYSHRSRYSSLGRWQEMSRSRSRSPPREPRQSVKGKSGFDVPLPGAAVALGGSFVSGQIPGTLVPQWASVQPTMKQGTRHARRVYVAGLPPTANEETIAAVFNQVMSAIGGNTAGPGDAVVNVYINQEKKFAFVEMRTVEEASNTMALDGLNICEGVSIRVRRPSDYNPSVAAMLGPSKPNPHLNLAAVGLIPGSAGGGADGPSRIFVGGLPYFLTEESIKELLESFGPLQGFDVVKDRDTGNSKGYGFCVYQDPSVVDIACASLNGIRLGGKILTVRRATASGQSKLPDQADALAYAQQQMALQFKLAMQEGSDHGNPMSLGELSNLLSSLPSGLLSLPGMSESGMANGFSAGFSKVICLVQVVAPDELAKDEEYDEIVEDMKAECAKFGPLPSIVIPRPRPDGEEIPGLGTSLLNIHIHKMLSRQNSRLMEGNSQGHGLETYSSKD